MGRATVGFEVCVKHVAAAPEGTSCTARARLEEIRDGRRLHFTVEVTSDDGTIGIGESAIDKLLDVLADVRKLSLPRDPMFGKSTLNIGTISGGRAPNVIADEARADLMFRTVGDPEPIRAALREAVDGRAELQEMLHTPALHLEAMDGFEKTVVAYTTDIPNFAGAWGKPFLIGPGSIHVAHTAEERIPKMQLQDAIGIYTRMVQQLLAGAS